MEVKQTVGNNVIVRLDPENEFITMKSGIQLYVDTSFEPEKHVVRIGTVEKVPENLIYNHGKTGYPWKTTMELKEGDRVVMYFLAIQNCLRPEKKTYWRKGKTVWIAIKYHNIYAIILDQNIQPVNGYLFVEPVEDPEFLRMQKEYKRIGMEQVDLRKPSNTDVTYGKIKYAGKPNEMYADDYKSDNFHDEYLGDIIVMKRIRDIPVEYEYHAKIDNGKKLYRIQRHDILAVLLVSSSIFSLWIWIWRSLFFLLRKFKRIINSNLVGSRLHGAASKLKYYNNRIMEGKILAGKVLVKPTDIDKITASGIIIPDSVREKPNSGKALMVGADKPGEPMYVSVGDIVLYSKNIGQDLELDGKSLLLISQSDILFIQE